MASKIFKASWAGIYRGSGDYYQTNSPIRVGDSTNWQSYIGFNYQAIDDAISTSKTAAKIILHIYVTNSAEFDIGMHRETYNKKSDGLPYYRYAGFHPTLAATGWRTVDITNFDMDLSGYSGVNTFKEALNAGFTGLVLYGSTSYYGEAAGANNQSTHVYLEIQGTWNTKPGTPAVTYPTSGLSLTGNILLKGTGATDAEQAASTLRYQWGIYDGSWHYLPLTNEGQINLYHDLSKYKQTSAAKVALRAYDGSLYGNWAYSQAFTINHNKPPAAPSNMSPAGGKILDRNQDITFRWTHADTDRQSKFSFRWRVKGATTWNYIVRTTPNNYLTMAAGTLPVGEIEWGVQTFDQQGKYSPLSANQIFYASEASNAPTIIDPLDAEIVSDPNPVVQWSSVDQYYFEMEVEEAGSVIWSTSQASDVKGFQIPYNLSNDTDYIIRLRVKSQLGFWSDWDEITIHTSFTQPLQPQIEAIADNEEGSIEIGITNPLNTDLDVPDVARNEVFRRVYGTDEEYIKIANNIGTNTYFTDFTPASGISYEYFVRAIGTNSAIMDSALIMASVTMRDSTLMLVSNPEERVLLKWNPSKSERKSVERSLMNFNGREFPVAEYGQTKSHSLDVSFSIRSESELEDLQRLIDYKQILLFRDGRGRREFVSVAELNITDRKQGYEVSFNPEKVHYKEGFDE